MPYNLKHLVHQPNTKQSEIHHSLAPALFALFKSFFPFCPWVDAIFQQSTLEMKNVLKYWSGAGLVCLCCLCERGGALKGSWAGWSKTRAPSSTPAFALRAERFCSLSSDTIAAYPPVLSGSLFWTHIKADFHLEHFMTDFLSRLLIVPVRKQLASHSSWKHTSLLVAVFG